MKQRILVPIITALIFCAGYLAGLYTEQHRPLPAPPVAFLGEFNQPKGPVDSAAHHALTPVNRAQILAQVQSLLPDLEAFRKRSAEIDAQFEREIEPILTPDQRAIHAKQLADEQKRHHDYSVRTANQPVSDDELASLVREQPSHTIYSVVVIPGVLDIQTKRYNLDPDQREKVRALLKMRRERFLALVDSSPPPSVVLSRLAPMVPRLVQPVSTPAGPTPSSP